MKTSHIKKVKPSGSSAGTVLGTVCIPNENIN
jgi:hypothetical protein